MMKDERATFMTKKKKKITMTCIYDNNKKDNYALQGHLKSHDNTSNPFLKCKDVKTKITTVCRKTKMPRQHCCDLCDKISLQAQTQGPPKEQTPRRTSSPVCLWKIKHEH